MSHPKGSASLFILCAALTLAPHSWADQSLGAAPAAPRPSQPPDISVQPTIGGAPSFLDQQSDAEKRRMLLKQQQTFQLQVDTNYARALKAYCDSGYGDDRCNHAPNAVTTPVFIPPPGAGALPPATKPPTAAATPFTPIAITPAVSELPQVIQITGFGDDLSAILIFPDNKRLRVLGPDQTGPRSQLPSGEQVVSIKPGEVMVKRPGADRTTRLLFPSSTPPSRTVEASNGRDADQSPAN